VIRFGNVPIVVGFHQQMNLMNWINLTKRRKPMSDYWDHVRRIAEEIVDEHGRDEDDWHEPITETIGSDGFVLYYDNNEEVLNETDNYPDDEEVCAMSGSKN